VEHRIHAPADPLNREVVGLLEAGEEVTIQFSAASQYSPALLKKLDQLCNRFGPAVQVRFYGHYGDRFDGRVLAQLPSVATLIVDGIDAPKELHRLWELQHLQRLTLGVFQLQEMDILSGPNLRRLVDLGLGEIKRKGFDLAPIGEMSRLKRLHLTGQTKHIEVIATLKQLQTLGMSMMPHTVRFPFISDLPRLKRLDLMLGGREDIDEIRHDRLERLELTRVKRLARLEPAAFPALRHLRVEDQLQIKMLKFTKANARLAKLHIVNCKGLNKVDGLKSLNRLESLALYRTAVDLDEVLASGLPRSLRAFRVATLRAKEDAATAARLEALGYQEPKLYDEPE